MCSPEQSCKMAFSSTGIKVENFSGTQEIVMPHVENQYVHSYSNEVSINADLTRLIR
jgi:hypothetical protein